MSSTAVSSSSPAAPAASASAWPASCSPATAGSSSAVARSRAVDKALAELGGGPGHRHARPTSPSRAVGAGAVGPRGRDLRPGRHLDQQRRHLRAARARSPEVSEETVAAVVAINLLGATNGSRRSRWPAWPAQPGGGWIWNMEGFGSDGQMQPGMATYGATKRAVHLPDRVAGQGDQGQQRQGRLPVARHRRHRPADRRLRRSARGVREGQEDLQHPRRPRRDRHPVAGRAPCSPRSKSGARVAWLTTPQGDGSVHDRRLQEARHLRRGRLMAGRSAARSTAWRSRSRTSSPCCSPAPARRPRSVRRARAARRTHPRRCSPVPWSPSAVWPRRPGSCWSPPSRAATTRSSRTCSSRAWPSASPGSRARSVGVWRRQQRAVVAVPRAARARRRRRDRGLGHLAAADRRRRRRRRRRRARDPARAARRRPARRCCSSSSTSSAPSCCPRSPAGRTSPSSCSGPSRSPTRLVQLCFLLGALRLLRRTPATADRPDTTP